MAKKDHGLNWQNKVNNVAQIGGVETSVLDNDIKEKLRAIGVDYVQGYEIQEPQPLIEQLNGW